MSVARGGAAAAAAAASVGVSIHKRKGISSFYLQKKSAFNK